MANLATKVTVAWLATVGFGVAANGATMTVSATDFDVTYDPSTFGQFGTLMVSGDNLFFTPNNFKVGSLNGAGSASDPQTVTGIVLTAHPGFQFGALSLSEFGDYLLQGAGSAVGVTGQLRAFDYSNPNYTQTAATTAPLAAYPLTIATDTSQSWVASAQINDASVPQSTGLPGPAPSPWLASATKVDVTLENVLSAYTAMGTSPSDAFIEKKYAGGAIELSVTPVPLPGALWLLVSGVGSLLSFARRRF